MGCRIFCSSFRGFPQTQTTTLLGYFYLLGLWILHHSPYSPYLPYSPITSLLSHQKKIGTPSFPPQQQLTAGGPQKTPSVNSEPPSHEDCRKFHRCPWAPHHLPPPQKRLINESRFPKSVQHKGFTKNGMFLTMVMSIFFLFKRLINVEMVSELLVVHLSQMQLICFMILILPQKSYD